MTKKDSVQVWEDFGKEHPLVGERMHLDTLQMLLDRDLLREGMKVLDLGFGQGLFLKSITEKVKDTSCVGIDINRYLVNSATKNFGSDRIKYLRGDITRRKTFSDLKVKFDLIVSLAVFHHIEPSFEEVLRYLGLVLKKNGRIVFSTPSRSIQVFDGKVFQRGYSEEEVRKIASKYGFELLDHFDIDWSDEAKPRHVRRLWVLGRGDVE